MEEVTTKILDNTVLSASIKEIKCIDLIKTCSSKYNLATTEEVFDECQDGFDGIQIEEQLKLIDVHNLMNNEKYCELKDFLLARYPYLHKGEISSFLLSLLKFELSCIPYYFVTDDNKMRKVVSKIHEDTLFISKLGKNIRRFRMTGTIGLIKRMYIRGIISQEDIDKIIGDLQNSTFRITPDLINYLRGS